MWVSSDMILRQEILYEAHHSGYMIYPCNLKMYKDHKTVFWWLDIKKDIAGYNFKC